MESQLAQKYYIGLTSCYHDASISLVNNRGEIIFAEATERYTQNKRGFAISADNYFLLQKLFKQYPVSDYEIGYISTSFHGISKHLGAALAVYVIKNYIALSKWIGKNIRKQDGDAYVSSVDFLISTHFALRTMSATNSRYLLNKDHGLPYKVMHDFDHHLCHAYHAYFSSPYTNAVIQVIDGYGDDSSSYSVYLAEGQNIKLVFRNRHRSSLGDLYVELTWLCGFDAIGGEQWKVMGMAPYGKKNEKLYNDLHHWIYVSGIELKTRNKQFHIELRKRMKEKAYGDIPREDIAYTGQLFYEEIVLQLTNELYRKWPHANLVISGGCALNSAGNGKIHTATPYKNVFIPSAPADDGCAVGAALLAFKKLNPAKAIPHDQYNPYLGFSIEEESILKMAEFSGYDHQKKKYEDIYPLVAQELKEGKIVAWVQGRAEFGPRALGNRSILAHPSFPGMKDKINARVKFREEFRPFAPSILEEKAQEYFEHYHSTPYMERVLTIKENKRDELKEVNHADNTGRLQTVSKQRNPHFYNLIDAFYSLTGIPVLLNTSFNVMGKPITDSVNDMAAVFATSGVDVLVINDHIFTKKDH